MKINKALEKLRAGKVAVGCFQVTASADMAEHLSAQGLDFLILDWQHGEWTDQSISETLGRLIDQDIAPLVRVRSHDPGLINWVLDMERWGSWYRWWQTPTRQEQSYDQLIIPPLGMRSTGGNRLSRLAKDGQYVSFANDQILLIAMVESKSAIEQVDEIMGTDGIGGVLIGPGDLMLDLKGQGLGAEEHASLVAMVSEAGVQNDGISGFVCRNPKDAVERVAQGFRFIVVNSERGMVTEGAKQIVEALRK